MLKTIFTSAIILCTTFVWVQSTIVSPCSNGAPLPEVDVVDCVEQPCVFYINSTGFMTMKFDSPRLLEHIAPKAEAYVSGANLTYPLDQPDACVGITNTECPLDEGEAVEYTYGMFILPIFPPTTLILDFSLVDLDSEEAPFVCFSVELQVENAEH